MRTGAIMSRMPRLALDANGKILGAARSDTIANLGAYMSTSSRPSVPTYLYATLLSGQYDIPAIYCEVDAVYTNTVPVDALSRCRSSGGDLRGRAPGGSRRRSCRSMARPTCADRTSSRHSRTRRR